MNAGIKDVNKLISLMATEPSCTSEHKRKPRRKKKCKCRKLSASSRDTFFLLAVLQRICPMRVFQ